MHIKSVVGLVQWIKTSKISGAELPGNLHLTLELDKADFDQFVRDTSTGKSSISKFKKRIAGTIDGEFMGIRFKVIKK